MSVVPMIQCRPQGMTNSTLFSVRRIDPGVRLQPVPGHHEVHALGRAHVELARGRPASAWVSSVHTPVALITCLAAHLKLRAGLQVASAAPVTALALPRGSR